MKKKTDSSLSDSNSKLKNSYKIAFGTKVTAHTQQQNLKIKVKAFHYKVKPCVLIGVFSFQKSDQSKNGETNLDSKLKFVLNSM